MEFGPDIRDGLDQLFRWRRDVRHFQTTPIQPGLIDELLAQADTAPSVGLSQPWRWVKVTSPDRRADVCQNFQTANAQALAACTEDRKKIYAKLKLSGLEQAPGHLAVFCDEATLQGAGLGARTMPETRRYSCVCAIFQLWLAARARGLGLGWVSILDPDRLTQELDVPDDWHFIAYLCLGYPQTTHEDPELERSGWEARRTIAPLIR